MSKGSRSRVSDRKRYAANFDAICWGWSDGPPPACPQDRAYLLSPRDPNESNQQWAKRCVVIKNIGTKK